MDAYQQIIEWANGYEHRDDKEAEQHYAEWLKCSEWTTEPPTEPGLYRVKNIVGDVFWLEVIDNNGVLSFESDVDKELKPLLSDWYTHWRGPLPEPEAQKG